MGMVVALDARRPAHARHRCRRAGRGGTRRRGDRRGPARPIAATSRAGRPAARTPSRPASPVPTASEAAAAGSRRDDVNGGRVDRASISRTTSRASSPARASRARPTRRSRRWRSRRGPSRSPTCNRHRREGYDFCDTTHCQVLRPATDADARAPSRPRRAACCCTRASRRPCSIRRCAAATRSWPRTSGRAPSITRRRSQPDDACADEPAWESDVRVDQIERALRDAGHRGDRLRDLRVLEPQRVGPRRATARRGLHAAGDRRDTTSAWRSAAWPAGSSMKSTAFDVRRTGTGYRFRGRGFGHGVGLCVIGAGRRAAARPVARTRSCGSTFRRCRSAAVPAPTPTARRDTGASRRGPRPPTPCGRARGACRRARKANARACVDLVRARARRDRGGGRRDAAADDHRDGASDGGGVRRGRPASRGGCPARRTARRSSCCR